MTNENVPSWAAKLINDVGELKGTTRQILDQTTKTNGRVSNLERRVDDIEAKNDTAAGGGAVKKSFWRHVWDVGKIVIAAGIGAIVGNIGRWGK